MQQNCSLKACPHLPQLPRVRFEGVLSREMQALVNAVLVTCDKQALAGI